MASLVRPPTNLKSPVLENLRRLQRRLVILLGIVFPVAAIVIVAGLSNLFGLEWFTAWPVWVGIFVSGVLAAFVVPRLIRQSINDHTYDPELEPEAVDGAAELRSANRQQHLELNARRETETTLFDSEETYRQLVELSPDGIVIYSEGKIIYANRASARILGAADKDQLNGMDISDFIRPDYQVVFEKRIRPVQDTMESPPSLEQKYIHLDGRDVEVEVSGIHFETANRPAVLVVFRDISQRKQAESEIAQRNHELTILQSAGVAITSRLDLRYVLDTVVHEMTKLLNIENCAISEWNQVDQTIIKIAEYGSQGWWDASAEAETFRLAEFPVTRSVLEEQIPVQMVISQPNLDPAEYRYMRADNIKTQLLLPMVFQRRVLGLVELQDSRVERTFSYREISLVKLLANQAASAIENARLFDNLRQHVAELTTLNEISQAMISTLDLQKTLAIVTDNILQLLDVAMASVAFYDEGDNHLWFVSVSGEGAGLQGKRMSLEPGIIKGVIEQGKVALIRDLSKDPQFSNDLLLDEASGLKTRSVLCVPLQTRYRTIGVITAVNKLHGYFDEEDARLITLIAAPAAAAIENARLFEQAQTEIAERQRAETALEEERALLALRVRERTAELSKANAELARASRLKDEFLAGMSHELRTPLNTILGSSEILQTEVFGELNERQQRYAHNIEESGRHLLSLINDILDLSKVEAGKLELEIGPVSIQSVCEASLRLVKQLAHKKQLEVSTAYNNTITILQADERRLKQILVNLLSNAIKFTPEEGRIGLDVSENPETQTVHFTIWDTGIGISQEDMGELFQPFVQLDSRLARQQAGTGLGLSLVSRMTELHGGGVALESEVGKGSRFTVLLPYAGPKAITSRVDVELEAEEAPAINISRNRNGDSQPLILLADDNDDNINMILEFLQAQGFQVNVARNGKEAITRAGEEKPDIILMDIQMPEMDGLEATRHLKADVNLADVPIIALTALAMPGDRERCLSAGANEYLTKPVSPTRLVNTIKRLLN